MIGKVALSFFPATTQTRKDAGRQERRKIAEEDRRNRTMGVAGLLPVLKSVMDQVHVSKYAGKTAGVDACGWLYKGAYSCAADVVLRRDTDACVGPLRRKMESFSLPNTRLLAGRQVPELLRAADQAAAGERRDARVCV